MRLLVTGGCGFIGSNFVRYILNHYTPAFVSNVDALTYAGNIANMAGVAEQFAAIQGAHRAGQSADVNGCDGDSLAN